MASRKEKRGYSLFWRADKARWIVSAPDSFGAWKQHTAPESIKREHARAAEEYARELVAGKPKPDAVGQGPVMSDVAPKWMELRRLGASKPSTLVDNDTHLRKYILPTFGKWPLSMLANDVPALRRWVREVRAKLSASRTRNVCSTLRTLLDDAKGEGWVAFAENPMRSSAVRKELPEMPVREPVTLLIEQAQALISASTVPAPRRVRYALAFTTALADGEISGLTWGDVEEAVVVVRRAHMLVGGIGAPKNRYRVRRLPLHPAAKAALDEWRATGATFLLGHAPQPPDPVFPGLKRGGHARPDSAKLIRRDLKAIGQPSDGITFHATRRSLLTWLGDLEAPAEIRKRLAGHSRGDVTEEHYTMRTVEQIRRWVDRVPLAWTVSDIVPSGTASGGGESEFKGAPETNRTSGQRFRKPKHGTSKLCQEARDAESSRVKTSATDGLHKAIGSRIHCVDLPGHSAQPLPATLGQLIDEAL